MTSRSKLGDLAAALEVLARDIESSDGIANAVCVEASQRLKQIHADLSVAKKLMVVEARSCSRRSKASRDYEDALLRLAAEVEA